MALKRINKKAVEDIVTFAWQVSQSYVFILTGAKIFITSLGFETVGLGLATMILAVAFRIVATLVIGFGFHWKEKLFIPWAWIPKATVQIALLLRKYVDEIIETLMHLACDC